MRKHKFYYITLFLISCSSDFKQEYPSVIVDRSIENLYDIARFEIYKNCSNQTCSCYGYLYESSDKIDTFNILSCHLNLDSIYQSADTTTLFFSFFKYRDKKLYYINDLSGDCLQCTGVQFVGQKLYKAYFAEDGYFLYNDLKQLHYKDSLFMANFMALQNSVDNDFLKKYVIKINK